MNQSMEKLFNPKSVAIIGASEIHGKMSERRTRSLIEGGYTGKIFPINPKRPTIFNIKAYSRILDVEEPIDLVMIVVPTNLVEQAVSDSIQKGAKGIVLITGGMGEASEEGKKIEAKVLLMCEENDVQVVGPNCSGMFSAAAHLNILGIPSIQKGKLSLLAQSGNIIDGITHAAKSRNLGFSKIISAGNAIGIKIHQYIEYFKNDPGTDVILLYLESVLDGYQLLKIARETIKFKPIIAIKSGHSDAGERAARSHTGAMAVDDAVLNAAFNQAGITRVFNIDEMIDIATVFSNCPLPKGKKVVILSEGGGDNSLAADNAEKWGMGVPILSEKTQERLRPNLLKWAPAHNPIDYGAIAEENPDIIARCCEVCMQDNQVDALYVTGFYGGFKDIIAPHIGELEEKTSTRLVDLVRTYQKPLLLHSSFAKEPYRSLEILKSGGIPVFESSDRTAQSIAYLMQYAQKRRNIENLVLPSDSEEIKPGVRSILGKVKTERRKNLIETECRELLREYDLPLLKAGLAKSKSDAINIAQEIGYPVAMKIVALDVIHKSDIGGVKIGLNNPDAVKVAFEEIMVNASKSTDLSKVQGVLISPMAKKGTECIIGMSRDRIFGPVIMFGLGGIFVEALRDISFRLAPLSLMDAHEMIKEIKGYPVLAGIRKETPKDIQAIQDVLMKVSRIAIDTPDILELDLNPVIAHAHGTSIVDARIMLQNQ